MHFHRRIVPAARLAGVFAMLAVQPAFADPPLAADTQVPRIAIIIDDLGYALAGPGCLRGRAKPN